MSVRPLISSRWTDAPVHVHAFTTSRVGGASVTPFDDGSGTGCGGFNMGDHTGDDPGHVQKNRAILQGFLPSAPVWLHQVHGPTVIQLRSALQRGFDATAEKLIADASFTTCSGVVCAVMTADCLPVLLSDCTGTVVAAAHAGWRGLISGVLENTVAAMRRAGAGELTAWLGPSIGPTAFEVGEDVRDAFVSQLGNAESAFQSIAGKNGKFLADIYELCRLILFDVGIVKVSGGDQCTFTDSEKFFSYRRDGQTGRMASVIWIG